MLVGIQAQCCYFSGAAVGACVITSSVNPTSLSNLHNRSPPSHNANKIDRVGQNYIYTVYTVPYRTHPGAQISEIFKVTPGDPGACK